MSEGAAPASVGRRIGLRRVLIGIGTFVAALALMRGCNFVSDDRLSKVKDGMTESEVLEILGDPYSKGRQLDQSRVYSWTWNSTWPWKVAVVTFSPGHRVIESSSH